MKLLMTEGGNTAFGVPVKPSNLIYLSLSTVKKRRDTGYHRGYRRPDRRPVITGYHAAFALQIRTSFGRLAADRSSLLQLEDQKRKQR